MPFNHLVLVGGGHTNALLMQRWIMRPNLMPDMPITIISRDSSLVYSSMYPSVISKSIPFKKSLIDIFALANTAKISFIKSEVKDICFDKKDIILEDRPNIKYSKIILNCGSATKVPDEFQDLIKKNIACPIRPFLQSLKFIESEDKRNSPREFPFVIVGSGLGAIEVAFALRKRWRKRKLILVCDQEKIANKFLKSLKTANIKIKTNLNFEHKRILLCTGNSPQDWIKKNILKLDNQGRILTGNDLKVKGFGDIYAVGDCSFVGGNKSKSSGILAVKASKILYKNIVREIKNKKLKSWSPQKFGLQLVNLSNHNYSPKTFAVYGKIILGPSPIFWKLKNKIDIQFLRKFQNSLMKSFSKKTYMDEMDCRGCAAKIPQDILNDSLRKTNLNKFADEPEDASKIVPSQEESILQSVDGFPSLISDPWLNAKITTLHACSDLWACGAKLISGQILISIPKVENQFQEYIVSQSLDGVRSIFDELGGDIIGGHTYESRNFSKKPYSLGVELSLVVQGNLDACHKPWRKDGMKPGDILLMSRPLGIGVFFAAQMKNINVFDSYEEIFKNLLTGQQTFVDNIRNIQDKLGEDIINAATDVTGYGLLGHLYEMINASNLRRREKLLKDIKVILDLNSIQAYPGILDLINCGIKSSLFNENNKLMKLITKTEFKEQFISFSEVQNTFNNELQAKKELICDPQTCGPLLISCESKYKKYFDDNWYQIGVVQNKDIYNFL